MNELSSGSLNVYNQAIIQSNISYFNQFEQLSDDVKKGVSRSFNKLQMKK